MLVDMRSEEVWSRFGGMKLVCKRLVSTKPKCRGKMPGRLVKMELTFRLTLAHKPDIRFGTIALVAGIEFTVNASDHLGRHLRVCVWLLRRIREMSEERRDNELV